MSSHQTILVSRCNCRGFTLVEVIVVLLIIGVTVSLVFPRLVLPERFGDLASHSRNITSIIRLAKEESTFRGRILGVFSEGNEIKVKRLAKGEWIAYEEDTSLFEYRLKPPFSVDMQTQQLPFTLSQSSRMPIIVLPDGQSSAFELILSNKETGEKRMIRSDTIDIAIVE